MKKLILHNDNNKLHCHSFLHVCLYNGQNVWPTDQGYEIYHRHTFLGKATIINKRISTVGKLNESVAAITTGYSLQVLKSSLKTSARATTDDSQIIIITFRYLHFAAHHTLFSGNRKEALRIGNQAVAFPLNA